MKDIVSYLYSDSVYAFSQIVILADEIIQLSKKQMERVMLRCPCCNCLTINNDIYPIVEICEVCYWEYDEVGQDNPDKIIGPNKVSLNEAKSNYKKNGASDFRFKNYVRKPTEQEI